RAAVFRSVMGHSACSYWDRQAVEHTPTRLTLTTQPAHRLSRLRTYYFKRRPCRLAQAFQHRRMGDLKHPARLSSTLRPVPPVDYPATRFDLLSRQGCQCPRIKMVKYI